tara:strand:- start:1013 stop:1483 length:471 start_codon:yes stop_codon:yes gene_type:complete
MKKISIIKKNSEKKILPSDDCLKNTNHIKFVNMYYLNEPFNEQNRIEKELKKKLSGYKNQDKKKNRHDEVLFIKLDELVEKLVVSKLNCHYCKKQCLLFYKEKRNYLQWTLDRINNDIGHFNDNVVISCLGCNLQKRRRSDKHFKFAKQMNIVKKY